MLRFPLAGILLPVSGIGALALVLPMFVFLCFRVSLFPGGRPLALPLDLRALTPSFSQNDFLNTNIIFPKHYFYVFRRTYASVLNNNGKVGGFSASPFSRSPLLTALALPALSFPFLAAQVSKKTL